jgi:hypothetical protein
MKKFHSEKHVQSRCYSIVTIYFKPWLCEFFKINATIFVAGIVTQFWQMMK